MRNSLIILFLSITLSLSGATYYVSTTGNDGAAGTLSAPWKSWNYAFNRLVAGDVLYIRGGVYTTLANSAHGVTVSGKNGTSSNKIYVSNYLDEIPVLDCSSMSGSAEYYGISISNSNWWHIKGLTVRNVRGPNFSRGLELAACSNITLEQMTVTLCGGGFTFGGGTRFTNILYLNCDVYDNWDVVDNGGYCNGFNGNVPAGSTIIYEGCRAWLNSDDGYDNMAGGGYMTYRNCWAFNNGHASVSGSTRGDGDGFKLGYSDKGDESGIQRTLYNCISAANDLMGFDESMDIATSMDMALYNCIAYDNKNDMGFRFSQSSGSGVTILKNNISYLSKSGLDYVGRSRNVSDHNSWDSGAPSVTNADFVSTDWTELASPRKSDGSLPDINFLQLASGSDLIDKGVDVGLAYSGNAPDLGAFEMQTGTPTAPPVYSFSVIENATPSLLELYYNLTLANVVPAASAFNVLVNSTSRSVSSVVVTGKKVQLTLASPIVYGDVVTISYSKPSSNPLQVSYGVEAASISAQGVTNKVNAVSPVYVSSVIANSTPSVLEMTYNMNLANIVPAASSFKVLVNTTSRSVSSVSVSGSKVLLTLSSSVVYGNTVTVSYTKPSSNPLQSSTGAQAATLGAQKVTNNINATAPVYVSAIIANSTPSVLEMTYDINLALIIPSASSFKVLVNSTSRSVSAVTVSGSKVLLTLSSPVVYGNKVTVSYTKPSSNPLQSSSGAQAATLSAQTVTNNINAPTPVYVSAIIANSTPSVLEMTYNMNLANIVPAASAFKVLVNSSSRSVSSVAVSGSKVMLTLSSSVVYGNTVTVSYTKPSSNPLQSSTGSQAATLSAQTVTNNINAPTPVYVSAIIANSTPSVLEMTYNMNLANIVPAASAFKVLVNSSSRSVSSVAVSGSKVMLTLSSSVVYGNTVTVSYTKPSSNPLQSSTGSQAATISAQTVTNNINAPTPVYVSAIIANSAPSVLEMTYNMNLANTVPAASAFKVLVNSTSRSVSSVAVSGTKVQLTLSSPAVYGNTVTVSYTKPTANPLQSSAGVQASTLSPQNVTNNIIAPGNIAPTVEIVSPERYSPFIDPAIITITADASDEDGTVTLVEFFNGTTSIGSKSSLPYSFSWYNVTQGTYSITVVATDDKGAKTTSTELLVTVTAPIPDEENQPPVVTISSPSKGYRFENLTDIEILVGASDPDGTISMVELYNGSEKLVEMTTAPYSFIWKGVTTGKYKVKAIATDNSKATAVSAIVEFTVTVKTIYDAKSEIINLFPNPNNGHFTIDFLVPLENPKNEIVISDMVGNQIYREIITAEQTTKQLDLPNVKSGIYIMTFISNEILVTKKILIK